MQSLSGRQTLKFPHCVFPIRLPRSVPLFRPFTFHKLYVIPVILFTDCIARRRDLRVFRKADLLSELCDLPTGNLRSNINNGGGSLFWPQICQTTAACLLEGRRRSKS